MKCEHDLPDDWTPEQVSLFTRLYAFMMHNQGAYHHQDAPMLDAKYWHTVCHNAAWTAAELRDNESVRILDGEDVIAELPHQLNS